MPEQTITDQIAASIAVKQTILHDNHLLHQLQQSCDQLIAGYRAGHKVLIAGNGGSAADAQHIAAELVSRFYIDRPGLAALALTTDTSALTAISNDYAYDRIFARQIEALGQPGDTFIAISTSGNSVNILEGLYQARNQGLYCLGLTGQAGGEMRDLCDLCLCVPSQDTPRIQESHILLGHILCAVVESTLYPSTGNTL